jgi:acyl-CoA thioesterase-2
VTSFVRLLELEPDGQDRFLAPCPEQEAPRLFGGQVAAQALRAGCLTTPADRPPHSLHAYFLRPGRPGLPIRLAVTRSRDGRSFSTRVITASQRDEVILMMMASFQTAEDGPDWQPLPRPDVAGPDEAGRAPSPLSRFSSMASFDIRPLRNEGEIAALHPCWVRLRQPLPDDPGLHACGLAFLSDMGVVSSARMPGSAHRPLSGASLDHALWLHRPASVNQWLLFSVGPATNAGRRGLATGTLHSEDGPLVASIAQEAILRPAGTFPLP